MRYVRIFFIRIKNTLSYRHNLVLLTVLPALAAAGAWAMLTFYLEGGASIPVGILDYDMTHFSGTAISRFAQNSSVGTRMLDTGDPEGAERLVRLKSLEAVVVILPGFEDRIKEGKPEGLFEVICEPEGITRGLVAELFAAQVSRLYFNCDSANRVVRDAAAAARSAKRRALTESERAEIYEEAFAFADAYWEPEPLMTVEYAKVPLAAQPASKKRMNIPGAVTGNAAGWQDLREMLNGLIYRAVIAIFFAYMSFCVANAAGSIIGERADGIFARLRSSGFNAVAWIAISAATPFLIYGLPGAALLAALTKNAAGVLLSAFMLMCVSTLGSALAYFISKPGLYKIYIFLAAALSALAGLYAI